VLHRLLESADSPCRPEAAALAPPPAPLVRAALDIVRTYVHNQSERGVDGLASVSATTAALKADMVTFAASGASRIPPGAAGASLGLRPAAEAALEEVALLDPQSSLGSARNVATRAACRLMEVKVVSAHVSVSTGMASQAVLRLERCWDAPLQRRPGACGCGGEDAAGGR